MRGKHQAAFERELAASTLFAALSPEQIHHLARTATRVHEPKGMVFSKEGERGDELVVLLEGTVEVRRDDDGARACSVRATTSARWRCSTTPPAVRRRWSRSRRYVVAYVSRHHFDTLLATNPSLRAAIEHVLHERTVRSEEPSSGSPNTDQ